MVHDKWFILCFSLVLQLVPRVPEGSLRLAPALVDGRPPGRGACLDSVLRARNVVS